MAKTTQVHSSNTARAEVLSGASAPSLTAPCVAVLEADQSITVTFAIPPDQAKRILGRAGKQDTGEYLWQNVIRRAVEGHVF